MALRVAEKQSTGASARKPDHGRSESPARAEGASCNGCQAKSTVRNIHRLEVARRGSWLAITVTANAFLQHMVRNLVGVLVAIGRGDYPPEWARDVLLSRDRTRGGVTADPSGLYLTAVEYPSHYGIPQTAADFGFSMPCALG